MRILLTDADKLYLQSFEMMLRSEKMKVYAVDSGAEAVELGKLYEYDLILLGDTLDLTPEDVAKSLRIARVHTPILIATGQHGCATTERVVHALNLGADDYMTKPFYDDELLARIRAVVRRSKGHAASTITVGDVTLNLQSRLVEVNRQVVTLTNKEFQMFQLLMLRKGIVQTKEAILNYIYGGRDEPDLKIIDVFICKLRKKLPEGFIQTVWGRGYMVGVPGKAPTSPSIGPEVRAADSEFGGSIVHGVSVAGTL
jgi:two-component system cell cycle response regulator CtrA